MKWRVVLEPDSETGEWAVWCPELPGCVSAGDTEQEAIANIREAISLYSARAEVVGDRPYTLHFSYRYYQDSP
jgi:predicted RNase H-like HicB family nuclease